MTPEERDIFVGTIIQESNEFIRTTGKKISTTTFIDSFGNRSPIAVLLRNRCSSHSWVMSSELSKKFGFEITPRDVSSFNRGLEDSLVQYWDEPIVFAMGKMVRDLFCNE